MTARYWLTSDVDGFRIRAEVTQRQYAQAMHEAFPEHYPIGYGGPLDPHFWRSETLIPATMTRPGLYMTRGGYIEEAAQ